MKKRKLSEILLEQGIDPEKVLVFRHTPKEPLLHKEFPRLAMERPDLFNAYQQSQSRNVEKQLENATYLASFIGRGAGRAAFVGLYKCGNREPLTVTELWEIPENRELRRYGYGGFTGKDGRSSILWFNLKLDRLRTERMGNFVIKWPGREINRSKWANKHTFLIMEGTHPPTGNRVSMEMPPAEATPESCDLAEPPKRLKTTTYRILRDTKKAREVKKSYNFECQICGHTIQLPNGDRYAEAHHIKPLGGKHEGRDVPGNILFVCPNHHAVLDLGVSPIDISVLRSSKGHSVDPRFVEYHNKVIFGSKSD
jgi:hypothetical protein